MPIDPDEIAALMREPGLLADVRPAMSDPASPLLWFEQPAPRWLATLPVGNGRLGATVFGRVYKETVIFNEESVWTRWPDDRHNPDAIRRCRRCGGC